MLKFDHIIIYCLILMLPLEATPCKCSWYTVSIFLHRLFYFFYFLTFNFCPQYSEILSHWHYSCFFSENPTNASWSFYFSDFWPPVYPTYFGLLHLLVYPNLKFMFSHDPIHSASPPPLSLLQLAMIKFFFKQINSGQIKCSWVPVTPLDTQLCSNYIQLLGISLCMSSSWSAFILLSPAFFTLLMHSPTIC